MKKIKKLLLHIIMNNIFFKHISDKEYLKIIYKIQIEKKLNLNNPRTFNEKLQWLKLYDRKDIYTTMVDKYDVKNYVANIIGEEYIIPTLGVYDKFDDIDLEKLPSQFVIKCTHDSGGMVICKDKKELNIKNAKKKINKCLKRNFYYNFREWPYKNVKPRILIEKYMEDQKQKGELIDYKFFCFNGIPEFLYVSEGLSNHKTAKISFVDMNYERTNFYRKDYEQFKELPLKPTKFEKMKELAKKLANGTTFLRVDFYEINENIYFSELTFYPNAGFIPFYPEEYDEILGDMLELPKEKIEEEEKHEK